jgi:hypothetical protein
MQRPEIVDNLETRLDAYFPEQNVFAGKVDIQGGLAQFRPFRDFSHADRFRPAFQNKVLCAAYDERLSFSPFPSLSFRNPHAAIPQTAGQTITGSYCLSGDFLLCTNIQTDRRFVNGPGRKPPVCIFFQKTRFSCKKSIDIFFLKLEDDSSLLY